MRAVDTDVVVRFLTGDDPEQAGRVRALIDEGGVFVSAVVLLESDWVLRSAYGFAGGRVASALRVFAGLPGVVAGGSGQDRALPACACGFRASCASPGDAVASALDHVFPECHGGAHGIRPRP